MLNFVKWGKTNQHNLENVHAYQTSNLNTQGYINRRVGELPFCYNIIIFTWRWLGVLTEISVFNQNNGTF